MANYTKMTVTSGPRIELHNILGLTGAEVSINEMPAGIAVPFVHSHKNNEEIYGVLEGNGYFELDGEKVEMNKGDWLRVSPNTKRRLFATTNIKYICIQVKENSLMEYTADDAVIY